MSNRPQYQAVHVVWLPMIKLPHTVKQASGDLTHCANPGQLVPSLLVGHDISAKAAAERWAGIQQLTGETLPAGPGAPC